MKNKTLNLLLARSLLLLALTTCNLQPTTAFAQGTAFTYQGRLNNGANPASGIYDLQFAIYDSTNSPGTLIAGPLTNSATAVSNGLFTVTLDFGAGVFNGANRALDIAVRTNGATAFTTLSPRQQILPTPYALFASTAGSATAASTAASVPASGIGSGTANINISGSALSAAYAGTAVAANIAATATTAGTATNLIGNVSDAQIPANLARLNGTNNFTGTNTFANVVIATNVNNVIAGVFTGNGGGLTNLNTAQFANSVLTNGQTGNVTINGSLTLPPAATAADILNSGSSTLMLADNNDNFFAGVGAGNLTMSGGFNVGVGYSALKVNAGGNFNTANGAGALLNNTSGNDNTAIGFNSMGLSYSGNNNTVCGAYALANNLSGSNNIALGYLAGTGITGNFNIDIGNSGVGTDNNIIRIGSGQTQTFIAGVLNGNGGGLTNLNASQLAGGTIPMAQLPATVLINSATGTNSAVALGYYTTASGRSSTALGCDTTASGSYSTALGYNTSASGAYSTALGYNTSASGWSSTALGASTSASGESSTALGDGSTASGDLSFAAGTYAYATNSGAFVWSDYHPESFFSAKDNEFAVRASGGVRFVTSGAGLTVDGPVSAGSMQMSGNVVMNDNDIQFRNDSYHGVGWYGGGKFFGGVNVNGPVLYGGSGGGLGCTGNGTILALTWTSSGVTVNGTFNNNSDRNAKQNFASVKPEEVLAKVAQLPVTQWSYKTDAATRHIGPMAQDFYAAFAVGTDERHIAPIDEGGVALAAIQGLNEKVESGKRKAETQIDELKSENADLKARLQKLEQLMTEKLGGAK
jgi:hypothetical protein